MPARVNFGYIDYSGERSGHDLYFATLTGANYDVVVDDGGTGHIGQVRLSLAPLTLANFTRRTVTATVFEEVDQSPPPNAFAQRELKAVFTYQDNTTAKLYRFEMPAPDLANIVSPNTDIVNMSQVDVAAFKSDFEAFCVSPDGNPVTLISGRIEGRNL